MTTTQRRPSAARGRPGESGMALVTSMVILAVLAILAAAGIATSTLEVRIAAHDRDAKQAFYLCEAGLERAKFELVRGWGSGTGGGTFPNFTFQFDSTTMPDILTTSGSAVDWGGTSDKWAGFTLVDRTGTRYLVASNAGSGSYQITDCTGPTVPPADGRAALFYSQQGGQVVAWTGAGAPVGNVIDCSAAAPGWTDDMWIGYVVSDGGAPPNLYVIEDNTADTLVLPTGVTAPANYEIWRAVGTAGTFTLYESDPAGHAGAAGAPNAVWRTGSENFAAWFLRDRTGALFPVTATSYGTTAGGAEFMQLTVTGTPASGGFDVLTSPWLVQEEARTSGGTPTTWTFAGPSTTTYGDVALSVTPAGPAGSYVLAAVSTSTTTGNAKEIRQDADLGDNGWITIRNWRQVR